MRLLFINLCDVVTQEKMRITNGEQPIEKQVVSKYDNIKSNSPVIRPVVSATSDLISEDNSVKTDGEEDNKFACPLYCGGYKNIDYDSSDRHVSKKCKLPNHY